MGQIHGHKVTAKSLEKINPASWVTRLHVESGMIRTQMGKQNILVMVAVYATPCAITPSKQ
jgi:hypothetical protein